MLSVTVLLSLLWSVAWPKFFPLAFFINLRLAQQGMTSPHLTCCLRPDPWSSSSPNGHWGAQLPFKLTRVRLLNSFLMHVFKCHWWAYCNLQRRSASQVIHHDNKVTANSWSAHPQKIIVKCFGLCLERSWTHPYMANGRVRASAGVCNQPLTEWGHAYTIHLEMLTSPLFSRLGTHLQPMWDWI